MVYFPSHCNIGEVEEKPGWIWDPPKGWGQPKGWGWEPERPKGWGKPKGWGWEEPKGWGWKGKGKKSHGRRPHHRHRRPKKGRRRPKKHRKSLLPRLKYEQYKLTEKTESLEFLLKLLLDTCNLI